MEDGFQTTVRPDVVEGNELNKRVVRAGKRTYFFDVKTTRDNDLYITITESKKCYNTDGRYYYEKHKVFLYEEDFEAFLKGLTEVMTPLKTTSSRPAVVLHKVNRAIIDNPMIEKEEPVGELVDAAIEESYSDLNFEDLETKK